MATKIFTALIHSDSFESATSFIEYFIKLFCFEKDDLSLEIDILEKIEIKDEEGNEKTEIDIEESLSETPEMEEETLSVEDQGRMKSSPYYQEFVRLKDNLFKKAKFSDKDNIFYSKRLSAYVGGYLVVYFPIWSAAGIKRFGFMRDSNATAENGFKILKHQVFNKELKIKIPRLIQKNEEIIQAKLTEREFSLTTTRQDINKEKIKACDENTSEKRQVEPEEDLKDGPTKK